MRKPPPPHPRGTPRTPGSGRRRGSLNQKTIELRSLMEALVGDVHYQSRLRADFRRRRVHPSIESLVWGHVVGRPAEQVRVSASVSMNLRHDEERELFARLSVEELEELAADSAALMAKARLMAHGQHVLPTAAPSPAGPVERGEGEGDSLLDPTLGGTDVARCGEGADDLSSGERGTR
jgi:hypothetical protein